MLLSYFGSMEGIVLWLRFIYLLMKLLISIFAVYRFWHHGDNKVFTLVGVGFYYFFTPYNIDALSYNTIAISMIFLIMVIMITHKDKDIDWFLCGIFLAIAILAHPFIVLVYVVCSAGLLFQTVMKRDNVWEKRMYEKMWIYVTCGSISVALIFCCFVFSRASLSEIIENLSYIFGEPDHDAGIIEKLWKMLYDIFLDHLFITIVNSVLCIVACINNKKISEWSLLGALAASCIYLVRLQNPFIENLIYIPFLWFALGWILKYRKVSVILAYVVILFSVIGVYFGTNTRILSTSAAMSNFAALSCFIIGGIEDKRELVHKKIIFVVLMILLVFTFILRLFIVWRSWFKVEDFQQYIDKGPLKGMYATQEVWNSYNTVIDDLDSIVVQEGDIFFCGTYTPLAYLYLNAEYGTSSFFYLDYDRINTYWEMHTDKNPDIIYYLELSYTDEEKEFIDELYDNYYINLIGDRLLAIRK